MMKALQEKKRINSSRQIGKLRSHNETKETKGRAVDGCKEEWRKESAPVKAPTHQRGRASPNRSLRNTLRWVKKRMGRRSSKCSSLRDISNGNNSGSSSLEGVLSICNGTEKERKVDGRDRDRDPSLAEEALNEREDWQAQAHNGVEVAASDATEDLTAIRGSGMGPSREARLKPRNPTKFGSITEFPALRELIRRERAREWVSIFRRTDPRYQILNFFNDVAHEGASDELTTSRHLQPELASPLLLGFDKASVFTVWRPTSKDAIRLMMTGQAVGKGLDIKGKSAKAGKLSGFVPFLQIYEERHKHQIQTLPKGSSMRIFYRSEELRDRASQELAQVTQEMLDGHNANLAVLADESASEEEREAAMEKFMWELEITDILLLNEYSSYGVWGLELPERVFWEAYVIRKDIMREAGSEYDTKRPSEPAFQDMNFSALRGHEKHPDMPRPVVWQFSDSNPMCPLNLLLAYEEKGRVLPVVSDFDCFLVGTRRVTFSKPLPEDQVKIVRQEVKHIEEILSTKSHASWTARWLEILKKNPGKPGMPRYGFGDPKSYAIMEMAVQRLTLDGSVRHGAECFNYFFPQELDEEFLVISDALTVQHKVPWRYMNVSQLQHFLMEQVAAGYTFPINPKWVLCDPGWKDLYDALLKSTDNNVKRSMNIWFPADIREQIARIRKRHPYGFERAHDDNKEGEKVLDGTAAMDLAVLELERFEILKRAKNKLRTVSIWMKMSKNRLLEQGVESSSIKKAPSRQRRSVRISVRKAFTCTEDAIQATGDAPVDAGSAVGVQIAKAKGSSETLVDIEEETDLVSTGLVTVNGTSSTIAPIGSPVEKSVSSVGLNSGPLALACGSSNNFPLAISQGGLAFPQTNKNVVVLGQGLCVNTTQRQ